MKIVLFDLGEVLVTLSRDAKDELDTIVGGNHHEVFRGPWFKFMMCSDDRYLLVSDKSEEKMYWHDFFSSMHRFDGKDVRRLTQIYMAIGSWVFNDGVRSLMTTLNIRDIKHGIISNAFPSMLGVCMSLGLFSSFEPIVLSYIAGRMKPDAEIFHLAMGGYEPSDCVFIDDNLTFAVAASKLGMHGVWLNVHNSAKADPSIGVTEVKSLDEFNSKICSGEIQ
jgi:HAD superfamily hydrolase (TIGR01509 family)